MEQRKIETLTADKVAKKLQTLGRSNPNLAVLLSETLNSVLEDMKADFRVRPIGDQVVKVQTVEQR